MDIVLGGERVLHLIDTPGHARHHHCIWDATTRGWFSGDTFGLSYREFDTDGGAWIAPTTPPTQFEPPALRASVQRLLSFAPACMYLTHYGRVDNVPQLAPRMLALLDGMEAIGARQRHAPDRHRVIKRELTALYMDSLARHGVEPSTQVLDMLSMDIELNAQGLAGWLDRPAQATQGSRA
jgi:glyoxylase-like metal-dependent hydrolase (beta-lactamase superfamily II)